MFVTRDSYATGEKIITGDSLTVLVQGVCSRGGAILLQGAHWGDAILGSGALRDTRDAKALAYVRRADAHTHTRNMPTPRPRIAWPLAMYAPGTDRPLCPRCCGLCCAQCEIARVSREALLTVSKDYPQSAAYLRLAGLKLATRRGFVLCSLVARIVSQQADNAKAAAEQAAQGDASFSRKGSLLGMKGKWAALKSHVSEEYNPLMRALRKNLTGKKQLAFVTEIKPVTFSPTAILHAIYRSNALAHDQDTTGDQWNDIEYDEERKPLQISGITRSGETKTYAPAEAPSASSPGAKTSPAARRAKTSAAHGEGGGAIAALDRRVDTLTKLVETMEANRRADSKEMLERLTRLEMPTYGSRFASPFKPGRGQDPDFHDDPSYSSIDHPPSRASRQSRRGLRMTRSRANVAGTNGLAPTAADDLGA